MLNIYMRLTHAWLHETRLAAPNLLPAIVGKNLYFSLEYYLILTWVLLNLHSFHFIIVVEVHLIPTRCPADRRCTSLSEYTVAANCFIIVPYYKPPRGLLTLPLCLTTFDKSCDCVGSICVGFFTLYISYVDLLSQW